MGDIEAPGTTGPRQSVLQTILPIAKEFASSRKGQLLIAEVALSLIAFICFVASTAAAFVTAPLIEFLAALFLLFAYSTKFNERFKGFHFPLMDFLRCVSASIIFFIISIISVSKFTDGASKAAGIFTSSLMTWLISSNKEGTQVTSHQEPQSTMTQTLTRTEEVLAQGPCVHHAWQEDIHSADVNGIPKDSHFILNRRENRSLALWNVGTYK
uniref:CKLF-like MARVEL transmembrane domain containing 3 n=2 Tax=Oncorhynchus TaxID=8016 RepID=A0A8C8I200_ONCTS